MSEGGAYEGRVLARQYSAEQERLAEEAAARRRQEEAERQRAQRALTLQERAQAQNAAAAMRAEARANRALTLQERAAASNEELKSAARKEVEEAKSLKRRAFENEAAAQQQQIAMPRFGDAYQTAAFGNTRQALAILNEGLPPEQWADNIAVDENTGDLLIGQRGVSDRIPYANIRRFLPRDPTEGVSKAAEAEAAPNRMFVEFSKQYDTSMMTATDKRAVREALAEGADPAEVATAYALDISAFAKGADTAQERLEEIDAQIAGLQDKQDTGWYLTTTGRNKDKAKLQSLQRERATLISKYGLRDLTPTGLDVSGVPPAGTGTPTSTTESTVPPQQGGNAGQRVEQLPMTQNQLLRIDNGRLDSDKNNVVDRRDAAIQLAFRVVEALADPSKADAYKSMYTLPSVPSSMQ